MDGTPHSTMDDRLCEYVTHRLCEMVEVMSNTQGAEEEEHHQQKRGRNVEEQQHLKNVGEQQTQQQQQEQLLPADYLRKLESIRDELAPWRVDMTRPTEKKKPARGDDEEQRQTSKIKTMTTRRLQPPRNPTTTTTKPQTTNTPLYGRWRTALSRADDDTQPLHPKVAAPQHTRPQSRQRRLYWEPTESSLLRAIDSNELATRARERALVPAHEQVFPIPIEAAKNLGLVDSI